MMPRRVVVTGIGAVTAVGHGVEGLWAGVTRRQSPIRSIERFDASGYRSRVAAEIDDFDPADYLTRRRVNRTDRFVQLTLAASLQAVRDADLSLEREDSERVGVAIGSALGGIAYGEEQHRGFLLEGNTNVEPLLALSIYGGAACCNVALELGLLGPAYSSANSCAAGAMAIGEALRVIRSGDADIMLAGGAEAPLAPLTFRAFDVIRAMSTRNDDPASAYRPFDSSRDGFVMGEGSAVMVFEERGRALARGAPIYAEVLGFGTTNDGYHMTQPRPDGAQAARAICLALRDAGISPDCVDYVNAHGSGTPLGDRAEAAAISRTFTGRVPLVSSTKALTGHPLGATGAIEAAICILSLQRAYLPDTVNLRESETDLGIRHVPAGGLCRRPEVVLSNSFGFGGINAALLFGRAA